MTFPIDEHIRPDSTVVQVALRVDGGRVVVEEGGAPLGALSIDAVVVVLRRYGKPLDASVALEGAPRLPLGDGRAVVRLHWRAAVDADARDWLVLVEPGREPVAALSPGIAAALRYLAARVTAERAKA